MVSPVVGMVVMKDPVLVDPAMSKDGQVMAEKKTNGCRYRVTAGIYTS
jgi:hypothetical protein